MTRVRHNDEFLVLSFSLKVCHDNSKLFLVASWVAKKHRRQRRKLQFDGDEEALSSEQGRRVAVECGPHNSSPVSVLDAQELSSSTST
ncbi:hypothetical protein GUJ93_ZPchr0010g9385 [Zizania palustris]|uniref:Uncharacterized protein n=1 Tax=Zizania palustris TaxID=103762 RepID=A0A8J6BKZ5_ZIZPA|nr:hypothetical protein GUJ93_ZPchr0010g9385 [Zizania palustris]